MTKIKPIHPLTEAEARKALADYRAQFPLVALDDYLCVRPCRPRVTLACRNPGRYLDARSVTWARCAS